MTFPRLPFAVVEALEARIAPAAFIVTSAADSGAGSLRDALIQAADNGTTEADVITFAIPGEGAHTIAVISGLPAVTPKVTIDGTSQPGFAGAPLIALSGAGISEPGVDGLVLGTSDVLKGLSIHSFTGHGVHAQGGSNTIQGSWIGLDLSGSDAGNHGSGIFLASVGSVNLLEGNVLSGNGRYGVEGMGDEVRILSNKIGTDAAGIVAVGNDFGGVLLYSSRTLISNNVISGNGGNGLDVKISGGYVPGFPFAGPAPAIITNNLIGVNATGGGALPNQGDGVRAKMSPYFTSDPFPDYAPSSRMVVSSNVISGNLGVGIFATGAQISITASLIGLNAAGTAAIANGDDGVRFRDANTMAVTNSVISGNGGDGLDLEGVNLGITGNKIGTDAAGLNAIPNSGNGILANAGTAFPYKQSPRESVISNNLIAYNQGAGIASVVRFCRFDQQPAIRQRRAYAKQFGQSAEFTGAEFRDAYSRWQLGYQRNSRFKNRPVH